MYQPPRPSNRASGSAASSPRRTNPHRTNHDRDERQLAQMAERRRSSYDVASSMSRAMSDSGSDFASQGSEPTTRRSDVDKINQILQQFFGKSALIILGSRVILPQAFDRNGSLRRNKWFNIVLDESEQLLKQIEEWKYLKIEDERPAPLIIEVYLDLADLAPSQALVTIDEEGRRWNVAQALNPQSASTSRATNRPSTVTQLTLERWEIELDDTIDESSFDKDVLAVVYKQCVPLIRSLYTYVRLLPAFKYYRKLARQAADKPALKLKYRILSGNAKRSKRDTLEVPLSSTEDEVIERYRFEPQACPVGTLGISVAFRSKCDFRIDDSESLLSSHFMADDHYFKPSLSDRRRDQTVPSSVPTSRRDVHYDGRDQGQVYGSLSTFHKSGGAALGTSPLSAMRAIRDDDDDDELTPSETPPQKILPNHRTATGYKPSLRSEATPSYPRRPSVSFQPFKAGSVASSPGMHVPPSPGSSVGRQSGFPSGYNAAGFNPLAQARNRNSLTTLPQQALRAPIIPNETAIASSASSSPKPAPINRYSSSFSHRRSRFSSDGGSRREQDEGSSGRPSPSNSTQRESEVNEGQGGSSGSIPQTDEESLKDFVRLLDQKKDLKSFRTDSSSRDATMRRTTAALNKYQRMRETNNALSDSMSSSLLLHRSSSSSSRQLSSVPAMVRGTSVSTSSSPGQPVSPHTPHTPAIPSRLSANSIVDYGDGPRRSHAHGHRLEAPSRAENSGNATVIRDTGTTPVDIPTSPRTWAYARRSSSVSQQQQERALADEPNLYGIGSRSVPNDERTELSMSELLQVTEAVDAPSPGADDPSPEPEAPNLQAYPFPSPRSNSRAMESHQPRTSSRSSVPTQLSHQHIPRRGHASSRGDVISRGGRGSPSFSSESRGSRISNGSRVSGTGGNQVEEDDGLIFHLSELGSAGVGGSRRSIEEGRGGGNSGTGSAADRRKGGNSPWS